MYVVNIFHIIKYFSVPGRVPFFNGKNNMTPARKTTSWSLLHSFFFFGFDKLYQEETMITTDDHTTISEMLLRRRSSVD